MHALLCSLPGTPVLYYGDEIGMGDNVYLGDRDSVRTPMQWSADRNAGFSDANPQRLYLPAIIDPEYSYESVNVAAQLDNPDSLLWWVRRLIALRRRNPVFGHGTIELLSPDNHRVLAFLRPGERSRDGQRAYAGARRREPVALRAVRRARPARVPRRASGRAVRPDHVPCDRRPAVPAHARPARVLLARARARAVPSTMTDTHACRSCRGAARGPSCSSGATARPLDAVLPRLLRRPPLVRRQGPQDHRERTSPTGSSCRCRTAGRPTRRCPRPRTGRRAFVRVEYADGEPETYVTAGRVRAGHRGATARRGPAGGAVAILRPAEGEPGVLVDAHWLPGLRAARSRSSSRRRRQVRGERGSLAGVPSASACGVRRAYRRRDLRVVGARRRAVEHVAAFDERLIMKTVRRLEPGAEPGGRDGPGAHRRCSFPNAPPLLGALEYRRERRHDGDGRRRARVRAERERRWTWYRECVGRFFDGVLSRTRRRTLGRRARPSARCSCAGRSRAPRTAHARAILAVGGVARAAGRRTAPRARVVAGDPAFTPEPVNLLVAALDVPVDAQHRVAHAAHARTGAAALSEAAAEEARASSSTTADALLDRLRALLAAQGGLRIRVHGDLHLGQVLSTGNDFVVHRLRRRAGPPPQPAADQAVAAARRRRDAAFVRLRRVHGDPRRGRTRAGAQRRATS